MLQREERKLEKLKESVKASGEEVAEKIAALLKDENQKKALARDAMEATRDRSRRDELLGIAQQGAYQRDRDGVITGREPRPWER
jgi:hypothetical protein